jgi:hypothetical protein
VGWINYVYYNQQKFVNYNRDTVKGTAEWLGTTTKMTWENQMILAEKGEICVLIGG